MHQWRFFKAGGVEQVKLESGADVAALSELDLKLWVALSCPSFGLEIDARTLALIDKDKDGRIRASEIISLSRWVVSLLKNPDDICKGSDSIALSAIVENEEGNALRATAKHVVSGKDSLSVADFAVREAVVAPVIPAELGQKIDAYFVRAGLASYDPAASAAAAERDRANAALQELPLAVPPSETLPLRQGVNPMWAEQLALFADTHSLGASLSHVEWKALKQKLSEPTAPLDAIETLERFVRLHRDLFKLLNNFVAFRDFYQQREKAIFLAGTMYLDRRGCELCIKVEDAQKHAVLASLSRIYLAYCECVRRSTNEKMTIVAAFTAGDADNLMVGRNGVFYDRTGKDWDATVIKIVEHPISIRQAFFSPYKRAAKLIEQQVERFASTRDKEQLEAKVPEKFDVAKFAGVFAAIGLAIGAIGGAIGTMFAAFLKLAWWQMPLALAGILTLISAPSMVMASIKLRQRNIGPLLDASGWAINARAAINIPFGAALTRIPVLPRGAVRDLADPYAAKTRLRWLLVLLALTVLAAGVYWFKERGLF